MSTHAIFAPSSADRWLVCPGSVELTKQLHATAAEHNEYTASGTVIHAMGEMTLRAGRGKAVFGPQPYSWGSFADVGDFSSNWVTDEMEQQARDYHDAVMELRTKGDEMRVEVRAKFSDELYGTADCVLIDDNLITVIDLKTGAGNMVSPVDNKQLMTYAGMVLAELPVTDIKVRLVIIQPPDDRDPVKVWDTASDVVRDHMRQVMVAMESEHLEAGGHCKWCPVRASCPILHQTAMNAASLSLDGLTPEKWALALEWAEVLKPWCKSVEDRATQLASEAGLVVPGYKLVEKFGRKTWEDKETVSVKLSEFAQFDEIFNPPTLRTPTQLAKELKDYDVGDLIEELSVIPERGVALVKEKDKRPSIETGENLLRDAEQLSLFN